MKSFPWLMFLHAGPKARRHPRKPLKRLDPGSKMGRVAGASARNVRAFGGSRPNFATEVVFFRALC
jgi:hypothetical protein